MACQRDILYLAVAVLFIIAVSQAADVPKSAFGEAFDEIVVQSTLTVRGKGGSSRQSRNKNITLNSTSSSTPTPATDGSTVVEPKRSKRESSELYAPRVSNTNLARPSGRVFQVTDLFGRNLASPGGLLEDNRP
ncbi:uncharacterized protein LOC110835382 [Zootermopsis nevadensis]|uniref:Uncharacterized protein n=1 Tax=Zootermopsis nevadensis TaxID=136037 RepID=A0A067R320_ZOONE|nr:uncharacterized protein LOC110835382 [Zootermopsis nevadensis]KDR13460.1 hypothetical protein L798_12569 [Zootermopsis nevadensis]